MYWAFLRGAEIVGYGGMTPGPARSACLCKRDERPGATRFLSGCGAKADVIGNEIGREKRLAGKNGPRCAVGSCAGGTGGPNPVTSLAVPE